MTSAKKLTRKKEAELRLIADSTYDAIVAVATKTPAVVEES